MSSDAILERLLTLHPKAIDLSLGRTLDLLDRLGRPQNRLPPVVHVAGTNGKGSTVAFLRAILEAAGYQVHVYSSPHLVRFAERIVLAGAPISEEALTALLAEVEAVNAGDPITYFEITTCAAFRAFAEAPADILLLETGLGGRLDSTNVVDRPVCTAITPVSMDHMRFLGDTLPEIAGEKAAIQKPGVPTVIAPQASEAMAVIRRVAAEVGAPIIRSVVEPPETVLALKGAHQRINAGAARAVAEVLTQNGFTLSEADIAKGLASATWPARLQKLGQGPLIETLRQGAPRAELWLDGGHNEAAAAAIAEMAREAWCDRPLHLVVGMINSKAAGDFLARVGAVAESVQCVAIPGEEASFSAQELFEIAGSVGVAATARADLNAAMATLREAAATRVLICGSLYLAGRVLRDHA
ncbi:MAG: folylpolyglutamate synthase/dihydrofolate synthase family protein [Alphaproteobacteria bacterium]|nr:folylpolyglutamate synthase/dihydrofolate synthase family protein [Alphaproteobacteria bacterium]